MSKQKKVAVETTNHAAEAAAALGRELRRLREQKGLTINEVAARLKLPARQIETLERGEYVGLPEPVFVRGFLRSYGRFLGIDETRLNDYLTKMTPVYQEYQQRPTGKGSVNYTNTTVKKSFPKWIWGVLAVLAIGGGVYAWQMKSASEVAKQEESQIAAIEQKQNEETLAASNVLVKPMTASDTATETVTASAVAPVRVVQPPVQTASVPAVMGVAGELVITTKYRTMLTVTDISGKVLINTIVPANSEHRFKEGAPFDVRIGYAVGTVANFAGTPIDIDSKRNGGKSVSFTAGAPANTN